MILTSLVPLLELESRIINRTCAAVLTSLKPLEAEADYSLAIAGYFKLLEIELSRKIFEPFAASLRTKPTAALFRESGRFSRFVNDHNISLSEMLMVVGSLGDYSADSGGGSHQTLKSFLRRTFHDANFFYGKQHIADKLLVAVNDFRHPAIHTHVFTCADHNCLYEALFGNGEQIGLLNRAVKALRRRAASS